MVSLTFDDGPDAHWTPLVLDALQRAGVTATFFVVAEQIAEPRGPELLVEVVKGGHRVEAHCARHVPHDEQDRARLCRDLEELLLALDRHGLEPPRLWRPPYGRLNRPESFRIAEEAGLELVLWTSDPRDYRDTPPAAMLEHVAGALYEDSVILLHDSRRYAPSSPGAKNTVALIEPLVDAIRRQGLELGALPCALSRRERRGAEDEVLLPHPVTSDRGAPSPARTPHAAGPPGRARARRSPRPGRR